MDNRLKWFGGVTTGLYMAVGCWYVFVRWPEILSLDPNELGDFLAGAFSPLAFLWLVLGFYQQGKELRLQVREMKNSVEQAERLVAVTTRQVETEIENNTLARRQSELASRPNFRMRVVYFIPSESGQIGELVLKNIGYAASNVCVLLTKDGEYSVLAVFDAVETGSEHHFSISLGPEKLEEGYQFEVSYVGFILEAGVQYFDLKFGGDVPLEIIKEEYERLRLPR